ncbi:MAG: GDP-mannose 4,6-dehydratase [Conexivisphaerales archaeon]
MNCCVRKGHEIHGIIRRNSSMNNGTMGFFLGKVKETIKIHYGNHTDANIFAKLLEEERPDKLYHLATQSFVWESFQNPFSTYDVNVSGTFNIVNTIKVYSPLTKLYFAVSSEMCRQPDETPQNEETPF